MQLKCIKNCLHNLSGHMKGIEIVFTWEVRRHPSIRFKYIEQTLSDARLPKYLQKH